MTTRYRTAALIYCLAICGYLRADIVDYPLTSDCTQTSCPPLRISQFNPALGSLDSISLSLAATFSGAVTYRNSSGTPGLFDIQFYDQLLLPSVLINTQTTTIDVSGEVFPDSSAIAQYTRQSTSDSLLSGNFQPYIGTGILNIQGFSGATFEAEDHDPNLSGPLLSGPSTDYTLNVDYSYSPSVLPEPSFLLLTAGLLGVLMVLALRKTIAKLPG